MAFGDSWHPAFLAIDTGNRTVAIEFDSDFGSCLGQKDAPHGLGRCSA